MFGQPEITNKTIKCEECGRLFKKINSCHLKKHKLSIPEYKVKWGFCATQALEALYIKAIRQEQVETLGHLKRLKKWKKENPKEYKANCFKKGAGGGRKGEQRSEQELNRLREMAVNVQSTERFKKKISEASKKMWQNPEYRAKSIKTYKRIYSTPEMKERLGKQSAEFWKNPENVKRMSEKRKAIWNTPEKKAYASERSKKYWASKRSK